MSEIAVSIKDLKKTYKSGFEALKGISLEVKMGDFFAILGSNGAGKSTTIEIITSIIQKSSGQIKIFGIDTDKDFSKAKSFIGVVPQEINFNIFENVYQILLNQAGYFGIKESQIEKRAEMLLKKLNLLDKKNSKIFTLSGGMKRRLMIARALINSPKILILDEPTAGVDVEIRKNIWDFVIELNKKEKMTIILTTHYLEEAEKLAKDIVIIDSGKIVENTTMKNILRNVKKESFILDVDSKLNKNFKVEDFEIGNIEDLSFEVKLREGQNLSKLILALSKKNISVLSMKNKQNRLESFFLDKILRREK